MLWYYDNEKSPALVDRSGLYMTGLSQARSSKGKIYQESDLIKYRNNNPDALPHGFANYNGKPEQSYLLELKHSSTAALVSSFGSSLSNEPKVLSDIMSFGCAPNVSDVCGTPCPGE